MRLKRIFHVFRNTPLGRETLLGAAHLCRLTGMELDVYIPREERFALHLGGDLVEIRLDRSYLTSPGTAEGRVRALLEPLGVLHRLVGPDHRVASTLPEVPVDFELMSCPRSLVEPPTALAPGRLGAAVRRLVRSAPFPVAVMPVPAIEWDRVAVMVGGSEPALAALAWARGVADAADVPLEVLTVDEEEARERAREALSRAGFEEGPGRSWRVVPGPFEEALWEVPRTALVFAGAFGQRGIRAKLLGSRAETIQRTLPNPLVLVGPSCPAAP